MRKWLQSNFIKLTLVSILITLVLTSPFYAVLKELFIKETETWKHLKDTLLIEYFINTLYITFRVVLYSLIFGILPAYLVSFYNFPFRKIIQKLYILPLAIPSYIMAYTYGDLFSYTGDFYWFVEQLGINKKTIYFNFLNKEMLFLILSFSLFPYIYLFSLTFFNSIPNEIINSAKSFGKSNFNIFYKIILPLSRPAISAGSFLVVMEILNEYGAVKYFGFSTLTTGVFRSWLGMGELSSALKLSSYFLIFVFVFIFLESYLRKGKYNFSKISKKRDLNKLKYPIVISIILIFPLIFQLLLPLAKIIKNTFVVDFNFQDIFEILLNTVSIALLASFILLILSMVLNSNKVFNSGFFSNLLIKISNIGYSVPGAIIAVGIISVFGYFNLLYLSFPILIIAYLIRFFAVSNGQIEAGFTSIGSIYLHSALNLGKSLYNITKNIQIPIMKNFLIATFIVTFVDITKELPLTLILRPFNFDTLATRTFDYASDELLTQASVPALIIIIISIIPILFLNNSKK